MRWRKPYSGRATPTLLRRLMSVALLVVASACTLNAGPEQETISGAPVVTLAAPLPNATFLENVSVNIQGVVSNAGPDIDRVEITANDTIIATVPNPNATGAPVFTVTHSWMPDAVGDHVIGMTAFRGDGSSSEPATVSISVVGSTAAEETPDPVVEAETTETTVEVVATQEIQALEEDEPAEDASTNEEADTEETNGEAGGEGEDEDTSGPPTATFTQGINVRRGPGTNFNPPIGSFAAGDTAEILGINPAGDWYKVRYYNAEGWVFSGLLTVSGDTSNIPVDVGPPTPIPATATPVPPTAVPATAVPQTSANLVAGLARLDPAQPTCGETFNVNIDLANLGNEATSTTGTFTVQDIVNGTVVEETQGPIPIIEAGETVQSANIPLTVSAYYDEEHTVVIVLNPSGGIPETDPGDNRREISYTLQRGNC